MIGVGMDDKLPLRARKKAKVREALIQTSRRLFGRKGYTETTLEEICEECDVTVQTLLRYFGSKDDLLFANHSRILERFGNGLRRAVKRKESVEYWKKFLGIGARQVRDERETWQTYRIILGAPSLLARFYEIARQYQALLEQALCEEQGIQPATDPYTNLLALMMVVGPIEEAFRVITQNEPAQFFDRVMATADFAARNFPQPGEKARKARRPARRTGSSSRVLQ
jgi:AcrR family transcriptional regulator